MKTSKPLISRQMVYKLTHIIKPPLDEVFIDNVKIETQFKEYSMDLFDVNVERYFAFSLTKLRNVVGVGSLNFE